MENLIVQGNCDIVTYKKYAFGYSDDQIIFLIYIRSPSMIAGLEFPMVRAIKMSFIS